MPIENFKANVSAKSLELWIVNYTEDMNDQLKRMAKSCGFLSLHVKFFSLTEPDLCLNNELLDFRRQVSV